MYKIIGGDQREYGPIPAEVLRQWIAEGRANAQTRVLPEGATEWKTLAELPEFSAAVSGATVPPPLRATSAARASGTNPLAVAGMILGALSVSFGLCCCVGLPFSLPGLICSGIALSQMSGDPQQQSGRGLAIAGLVLSSLGLLAALFFTTGFAFNNLGRWHGFGRF